MQLDFSFCVKILLACLEQFSEMKKKKITDCRFSNGIPTNFDSKVYGPQTLIVWYVIVKYCDHKEKIINCTRYLIQKWLVISMTTKQMQLGIRGARFDAISLAHVLRMFRNHLVYLTDFDKLFNSSKFACTSITAAVSQLALITLHIGQVALKLAKLNASSISCQHTCVLFWQDY